VVVHISEELVDAGVEYWASGNPGVDRSAREAAREKLRRHFLRKGERAFLLLVKPVQMLTPRDVAENYDDWAISVGPPAQTFKIVTLGGESGEVLRSERTLDGQLCARDGLTSCLLFVKDNVDEEAEPCFTVEISGVRHLLRGGGRWLSAKETKTLHFRFETGDVKLLALLQRGVPWKHIEAKYLQPRLKVVTAQAGSRAGSFLRDVAASLVAGLILRLL
jgi:hypothetical protein